MLHMKLLPLKIKNYTMQKQNKFIIVVPVYNAEKYIFTCIESILKQTYKNYELIVVNDKSTDRTKSLLSNRHTKYKKIKPFMIIERLKNSGSPLDSFSYGIDMLPSNDPEDIIITVDGDDYLYDNNVLDYLNSIYQDPNIWMSYGQYVPLSKTYKNYCKPIIDFRNYRRNEYWCTSHLRTLKRKIWNNIDPRDLKDENGNFYKYAGDLAYMFPALEMCGPKHTKFIDKVLYVYNDLNDINQMKICGGEDLRAMEKLRVMPLYDEIV